MKERTKAQDKGAPCCSFGEELKAARALISSLREPLAGHKRTVAKLETRVKELEAALAR
jgi:hypothetical protein